MKGKVPEAERLRSALMVRFFGRVMARQMAHDFHAVRLARPGLPDLPPGRPVVVYANHPSWWDPALFIVLATSLFPHRIGFGPIEAAQLKRYPFFRRIGLFGVEPGAAMAGVSFLGNALRLLEPPGRMLWMTAEGAFTDPRSRPVEIKGGLPHLAARLKGGVLLPLAIEYPFWNERKPEALCRFGRPIDLAEEVPRGPAGWNWLLAARLEEAMDALAEQARARDPAPFLTLLQGREGVGGAYDFWRRARAWMSGRPFDPAHDAALPAPSPRRAVDGPAGP